MSTNPSCSVLIVDKDAARRGEIAAACAARGATVQVADDPFSAMAALGQRRFDVLCAYAGPRHLSLRGLFQLARRKRHDISIHAFVLPEDQAAVALSFEGEAIISELSSGVEAIANALVGAPEPEAPPPATPQPEAPPQTTPQQTASEAEDPLPDLPPTMPVAFVDDLDDELDVDVHPDGTEEVPGEREPGQEPEGFEGELHTPALPSGAEALIAAFARELTGALVVRSDDARFVLYLYGGEPAWVELPGGDAALFERLVGRGLLPTDFRPEPVPEGRLFSSLLEQGHLSRTDAQIFMQQLLFDVAIEIAGLESCAAEVEQAPQFLATPPPFRVNPFGLVLESRRRRMSPDELLATSLELDEVRVVASAKLDKVYGKVAPFLRGVDVRALLQGGATLRGFREAAGVDAMLATQLVLALEAVGLVRIERALADA